ncbi:hypothetical protein S83_057957 [Arachis hypogaea]|nr:uncharacterized protein DS421_17g575960 [Arachis hypogaea]
MSERLYQEQIRAVGGSSCNAAMKGAEATRAVAEGARATEAMMERTRATQRQRKPQKEECVLFVCKLIERS